MGDKQITLDEEDIRLDAAKTLSERIMKRSLMPVVIVRVSVGQRDNPRLPFR